MTARYGVEAKICDSWKGISIPNLGWLLQLGSPHLLVPLSSPYTSSLVPSLFDTGGIEDHQSYEISRFFQRPAQCHQLKG